MSKQDSAHQLIQDIYDLERQRKRAEDLWYEANNIDPASANI
jgi:hypothetical protein